MKGLRWRFLIVIFVVGFSLYLLSPSILKFGYGIQVPKKVTAEDPWYYSVLPTETLNLGLDLRGGVHLVLGINFDEVYVDATLKSRNSLEDTLKRENVKDVTTEVNAQNHIIVNFKDDAHWEEIEKVVGDFFGQQFDFVSQTDTQAVLTLSALYAKQVKDRAVEQSLETLRNRIDQFGIAEPIIQRHGEEKILVQFPGVTEIGRIKDIISRTAKLTFNIVRSGPEVPDGPPNEATFAKWVSDYVALRKLTLTETSPITQHLADLNKWLETTKKITSSQVVRFSKNTDINTKEVTYIPYLLDKTPIVDGEELEDAFTGYNENNEPIVNFNLNPVGAGKFERGTGDNVGGYMAIVLDNNVHSAPRIRTRIGGGRALIEMGSQGRSNSEVYNEAKDTALVLRSGALPAKLEFLEERTIGPSLGHDSIVAGTRSIAVGLALVLLFMVIYYRASGFFAVLALVLNGILILASLAAFQGTLTLPGLAGITLTVGMAVDANVLIFEHIREELRSGKAVNMAIAEGYRRAFTAILDSNLTTILAALVLMSFGYGPIRGFAITLIIGLIASMFTAVFVTRVVVDATIVAKGKKTISI